MKRINHGNPNTAIGYLRTSTNKQELSPDAQRTAIEGWAAREGVTVAAWHLDRVGGSAEIEARPALVAALSDLLRHGAGVLAVARRDRVARDSAVAALIDREVAKCGAVIASAEGIGNGATPADAFLRSILDAASAYEKGIIRGRIKAALAEKRTRNERVGCLRFGFRLASDGRTLEPVPQEQAAIRVARECRTAGLSLRDTAERLEQCGFLSRAGRRFDAKQVARMTEVAHGC